MLIVHVDICVKPEFVEEFVKITLENARNSVKEPDIARFDLLRQEDDPTRFILIEVYRNAEGPPKHRETPHYNKWREAAEGMMAEPRARAIYSNLFPADEGW